MTNSGRASDDVEERSHPSPAQMDEPVEDADINTSSEDYAGRFTGAAGRWFIETQSRVTLDLLRALPHGASVLDVGGGHGQIAPPLIEAGYKVTVVGSHAVCSARLQTWVSAGLCRFEVADLQHLPYPDRAFDVVVCLRLLPHSISWTRLIHELCRVADQSVILDYPSSRSVNILSSRLFSMKLRVELNTRPFLTFSPGEIRAAFRGCGFDVAAEQPQYLVPMVLHRWVNRPLLSRAAEFPGRYLGITRWLGSPIILRADRQSPA